MIAMMRSGKARAIKQVYVVDISGPSGGRAAKEYEARSMFSAVRKAERELRAFPECQVTDIRLKRDWDIRADLDDW